MACYEKNVVATAIAEIGYQETPKGSNKNKYAAYIDKNYPTFYNGVKDGYAAWCDIFVDYCVLVNSADMNEALSVLCQPKKSCGAGCSFSYDYYKEKGRVGNEPKIGAQIFFGTGKKPTHTGIVIDVNNESVFTVEGNSDDCVKKHTYKKSSSRIFGYGYPRYTEEVSAPAPEPTPAPTPAPEPKPTPAPAPAPKPTTTTYKVTTKGSNLRLRASANTSSAVLASMPNGTKIEVDKTSGSWAHTTYKGKTGWASLNYLTKV